MTYFRPPCTLALTVANTSSLYDRFAISVPAGSGRFGKDVSAKKIRDVSANFSCRNVPYYLGFVFGFCFWFSTNWLGPACRIPVCRILELKRNDKTINVGIIQSIKCASVMSPIPLVPRGPLGPLMVGYFWIEFLCERKARSKMDRRF